MRKLPLLFSLASFVFGSSAFGAHLSCTGSAGQPNTDLIAFNFGTQVTTTSTSSGAGAGKPVSSLTVQIPLNSTYGTIYDIVSLAKRVPSCVLTRTGGGTTITISMTNVAFPSIQILSGAYYTNNTPGPVVELALSFDSLTTLVQ